MKIRNDYKEAIDVDYGLFAVKLSDDGWGISDGEGVLLTSEDEIELAGWHLPVKFSDKESAVLAINTGPHVMFDIVIDAEWTQHAIASGGIHETAYEI